VCEKLILSPQGVHGTGGVTRKRGAERLKCSARIFSEEKRLQVVFLGVRRTVREKGAKKKGGGEGRLREKIP